MLMKWTSVAMLVLVGFGGNGCGGADDGGSEPGGGSAADGEGSGPGGEKGCRATFSAVSGATIDSSDFFAPDDNRPLNDGQNDGTVTASYPAAIGTLLILAEGPTSSDGRQRKLRLGGGDGTLAAGKTYPLVPQQTARAQMQLNYDEFVSGSGTASWASTSGNAEVVAIGENEIEIQANGIPMAAAPSPLGPNPATGTFTLSVRCKLVNVRR